MAEKDMTRMTITPEKLEQIKASVDWKRVRRMTQAEIERGIANDPDAAPPLTVAEGRALQVQSIRKRTGLSQLQFGKRFHIPIGTLRDWEQARREPDTAAYAYLRVIEHEQEAVDRALQPNVAQDKKAAALLRPKPAGQRGTRLRSA